jgi:capsular polysaccharide biosynthesis protein
MTIKSFINLIKKEAGTLAIILATILAITAVITFTQPLRYEASNKLLIQQNVNKFDPYNVFKINEYYNNLIKEIVHSESFYIQVLNSNYDIDSSYFKNTRKKQIKSWDETIDIVSTNVGTMEIKTYHPDPKEAQQILLAVTDVLINKNNQYQVLDNNIDIKIMNQTTISKYPVKPNIILNFVYAFIIAILISLLYIYYKSEKEYHDFNKSNDNKQFKRNDKKTKEQEERKSLIYNIKKDDIDKDTEKKKEDKKKENNFNKDNDKDNDINDNNEKIIQEGEEVNLQKEIEKEADINNLFNK